MHHEFVFKNLITQLITTITNLVAVDNPSSPTITVVLDNGTKANLANLQIEFNKLLED